MDIFNRLSEKLQVGLIIVTVIIGAFILTRVLRWILNKRLIIPNSVISNETIINDSLGVLKICRWIDIGISYDSDMDRAIEIIQEEAINHPNCIDNRTEDEKKSGVPQVIVRLITFGDFSINLRAYVWTGNTPEAFVLHTEINKSIKKRFDEEGIEIPFPYRTIVYKKDSNENS